MDAVEFCPGAKWQSQESGDDQQGYLRGGYFNAELGWWMPYYVGKLKSYNGHTGYGFLECADASQIYGVDVYIHRSQVPLPWRIGQQVEFAIVANDRGQPQAKDVFWLPPTDLSVKANPVYTTKEVPLSSLRCIGTLKSYSSNRGYGFVAPVGNVGQHAGDVYIDKSQMPKAGQYRTGQIVEFRVRYNPRGQPQVQCPVWDPVPYLPQGIVFDGIPLGRNETASDLLFGLGAGSVNSATLTCLSVLLNHLQEFDVTVAVQTAVTYQKHSATIDYIAFVLDRVGEMKQAIACMSGAAHKNLLIALASHLKSWEQRPKCPADEGRNGRIWGSYAYSPKDLAWAKKNIDWAGKGQVHQHSQVG